MESTDIKNYAAAAFYIVLALSVVLFAVDYLLVDWKGISDSFNETMENTLKEMQCDVSYTDSSGIEFRYSGFCNHAEDIIRELGVYENIKVNASETI